MNPYVKLKAKTAFNLIYNLKYTAAHYYNLCMHNPVSYERPLIMHVLYLMKSLVLTHPSYLDPLASRPLAGASYDPYLYRKPLVAALNPPPKHLGPPTERYFVYCQ